MKTVFYQDENGNTRQMGEAEYKSAANWIASGIAATYNADITQMTVAKAKYFIAGIFDKGLLENLYSHEYNGRNRKGVMAELEKQRFMGPTPHPSPPGYCRLKTVENALNLPAGRFTEEQQSLLAQILTLPRGSPGSPWFQRAVLNALVGDDRELRGIITILEGFKEDDRREGLELEEEAEREAERVLPRINKEVLSACEARGYRRRDAEGWLERARADEPEIKDFENLFACVSAQLEIDELKEEVLSACEELGHRRRAAEKAFEGWRWDYTWDDYYRKWRVPVQSKDLLEHILDALNDERIREQVLSACEKRGYQRRDAAEWLDHEQEQQGWRDVDPDAGITRLRDRENELVETYGVPVEEYWLKLTLAQLEMDGHYEQVVSACEKHGYRRSDAGNAFRRERPYYAWDEEEWEPHVPVQFKDLLKHVLDVLRRGGAPLAKK